jgi:hypothetical protein
LGWLLLCLAENRRLSGTLLVLPVGSLLVHNQRRSSLMAESNPNTIQLTVPALAQAERLDKWLGDYTKAKMPDQLLSRSQVSKLLEKNAIIVNGKPIKKNYKACDLLILYCH